MSVSIKIDCPYDKMELEIAALSLENKVDFESEETKEKMLSLLDRNRTKAKPIQLASDYHELSPEVIANSPNMNELIKQAFVGLHRKLVNDIKKTFSLDDKEAWVLTYIFYEHRSIKRRIE